MSHQDICQRIGGDLYEEFRHLQQWWNFRGPAMQACGNRASTVNDKLLYLVPFIMKEQAENVVLPLWILETRYTMFGYSTLMHVFNNPQGCQPWERTGARKVYWDCSILCRSESCHVGLWLKGSAMPRLLEIHVSSQDGVWHNCHCRIGEIHVSSQDGVWRNCYCRIGVQIPSGGNVCDLLNNDLPFDK